MKRAVIRAILGMSCLGLLPAPCGAVLSDWELKVVDRGQPVSGTIVTVATPGGAVLDTKKTDQRGVALIRIEKKKPYAVTVMMPGGKSRVFQVEVGPTEQTSTVDVAGPIPQAARADGARSRVNGARGRVDPYVALFGGVNYPGSFTNVAGIEDNAGLVESDFALKISPVYGVKLGMFLQQPTAQHRWAEWIGAEIDLSYSNPHIKAQTITTSGSLPGFPPFEPFDIDIAGAHVRMMTAAMQVLIRYPGRNFQPYIGGGPAVFWGRISGIDLGTASDTSIGLQAVGGLRLVVTGNTHWFGFLEGRYQRATFDFGGNSNDALNSVFLTARYSPFQAVGGLGLHF